VPLNSVPETVELIPGVPPRTVRRDANAVARLASLLARAVPGLQVSPIRAVTAALREVPDPDSIAAAIPRLAGQPCDDVIGRLIAMARVEFRRRVRTHTAEIELTSRGDLPADVASAAASASVRLGKPHWTLAAWARAQLAQGGDRRRQAVLHVLRTVRPEDGVTLDDALMIVELWLRMLGTLPEKLEWPTRHIEQAMRGNSADGGR